MMSHGVDILKIAPSTPPPESLTSNDPQFQGFGRETTSIQLRLRGVIDWENNSIPFQRAKVL
jgi:hypothetical protein